MGPDIADRPSVGDASDPLCEPTPLPPDAPEAIEDIEMVIETN